jgi:hypothetical protein
VQIVHRARKVKDDLKGAERGWRDEGEGTRIIEIGNGRVLKKYGLPRTLVAIW